MSGPGTSSWKDRLAARRPPGGATLMEVCGTHTMVARRAGLHSLLPDGVRLLSGPGCPVCVTPIGYTDHAVALARLEGVVVATFGDLLRVPAEQFYCTAFDLYQTQQNPQEGRLAGAIGSHNGHRVACVDVQVQILQRLIITESDG